MHSCKTVTPGMQSCEFSLWFIGVDGSQNETPGKPKETYHDEDVCPVEQACSVAA